MGKGRIIGAASFGTLQDAFITELASTPRRPGHVVWVLVPTNLLALHLRRETARAAGGVLGVEFLTLRDAARRMAQVHLANQAKRPLPAGAAELALQRLLHEADEGSYLAAFRSFSNGASAIERTIRLLTNCLWRPEALSRAAGAAAFRDSTAPSRLRELAGIWAGFLAWKEQNGLFDADDLIIEAARPDYEPAARPDACFLYGFYDFTPAQGALVRRLLSLASGRSAYLLWSEDHGKPAPGFEYAEPTVRWLQGILGADSVRCPEAQAGETDLARLVGGVFGEQPVTPEGEIREALRQLADDWDGSVRVMSCPGEMPEAAEVAREVLRAARQSRGDRAATVGILLRGAEETAGLLAEALERAGVRYSIREGLPLARTVAGRVALRLLDLAGEDVERTGVVDFLAVAEVTWPEGLSATALDRLSRQAGVTRGRAAWAERLAAYAAHLLRESQNVEDEQEARACARDAELCRTAAGFLAEFFAKNDLAAPGSWADAARKLHALVREYAPPQDPATAPVLAIIDGLASLDVAGARPDAGRLAWMLGRLLARESLAEERFQHVGVSVSSIMGVRGATFDVVIVPGLVERNFPRHVPASSLLTELDREALTAFAGQVGAGRLPQQGDRPPEERYLFRIALASARRAVVLTYPRMEEHTGSPKIASRFLTQACSALARCGVTASMLDESLPAGLVHRVPLSRRAWANEDLELALDTLEYDGAVFSGPHGERARTGYLAAVSPFFARTMDLERQRWRQADFGPYDGKIRAEDLLESLRREHARFGSPVSPTRLETYASCPFQYFMTYVLGVEEVEAPPEEFELTPLERGSLLHKMLGRLFEERLKGRPLGELSDADVQATLARAAELLDQLGRVHAENHPATWTAERETTLEQLLAMLEYERREHAQAAPARFEYAFGGDEHEAYIFRLGPERAVAFRGRIDRVDSLPDGAIGIVDYKTGSPRPYKEKSLLGGRQLQLPIYLLAACHLLEADAGSACYLFVREPKDTPQLTLAELGERMDDFRRALRLIIEEMAAGNFFPLPPEDRAFCDRYCPYACACGAARGYLAGMKQTDPDAARLKQLRGIK